MSGSEDGHVLIWDLESGNVSQRLLGHTDVTFDAVWNPELALLATCSNDCTVRTWCYDRNAPPRDGGEMDDPWMQWQYMNLGKGG
eukprot:6211898-Pleurochrysis_carterae.AAC.1